MLVKRIDTDFTQKNRNPQSTSMFSRIGAG